MTVVRGGLARAVAVLGIGLLASGLHRASPVAKLKHRQV